MELHPSKSLADLARFAEREIRSRLASQGANDLKHEVRVGQAPEAMVDRLCPVEALAPGCLTFAVSPKYLDLVKASPAGAVIIPPHLDPGSLPCIFAPEPRLVFTVLMEAVLGGPTLVPGDPGLVRFKDRASTRIGPGAVIGDFCHIGAEVEIGAGALVYPHVFIDDHVSIGDGAVIYPGTTIFRNSRLGKKVIVHAGAVIGDDGFGYNQVPDPERGRLLHLKNAHGGGVVIGDFVEIGSQVCIDRGLIGPTTIGEGTKIDNLVHIAHNVGIGRDCIILAQVGIAGRSRVGDQVFILGQVGVIDGVKIGDGAIVIGASGVTKDIPPGREAWAGRPAQKADDEWKQAAAGRRDLPRLRDFFRALKDSVSLEDLKAKFFK
ncbi:MAG: UDP-3-O-(3-hydroxymyristoyl)glucosamine N-acyltransferase [Pseudomonadota bacterium]